MERRTAIRKYYMSRLVVRCTAFAVCIIICFARPMQLKVLEGFYFFKELTVLHVLWVTWMVDMLIQLIPFRTVVSIGSQKHFGKWYQPAYSVDDGELKRYTEDSAKRAMGIFIIWTVVTVAIGVAHHAGILHSKYIFLITVFFYVCDLICVLFWCPFRLILKNRCCTTCRIFNWDHLMMFAPLMFIRGFFTWSLVIVALLVWVVWEASVLRHPERFWQKSNVALSCSNCTDKLCTQYCEGLIKPGGSKEKKELKNADRL